MVAAVIRELSNKLSYRQRYILALTRTLFGSLSLIASSIIIYKIYLRYAQHKKKTSSCPSNVVSGSFRRSNQSSNGGMNTYYRMILGVSILDVMHAFWTAISVLPTPPSSGGVFAHGTTATCSAQGFFAQLTTPIVLYMATLNTYFMLKIRYNIADNVIVRRYEFWFHAIPIVFWLVTGFTGLALKIFNTIALPELGCWIAPYPRGCTFTNTCTRGFKIAEYIDWYAWSFAYIWLFLCVVVVLVNSVLIYSTIRSQERRNASYLAAKLQSGTMSNSKDAVAASLSSNTVSCSLPEFDFVGEDNTSSQPEIQPVVDDEAIVVPDSGDPNYQNCDVQKEPGDEDILLNDDQKESPVTTTAPKATENINTLAVTPSSTGNNARKIRQAMKQSRTAAVQSSLYLSFALFSAVWVFLPWMGSKLMVDAPVRFFFAFMVNIVSPSQGVFNLFIFVRLQYLHQREKNKDWSRWKCVKHCLQSSA
jgi:hypothetical protein